MFFFGLLSTPLPYLLVAVFYFIGFATGMFKNETGSEPTAQVQVKNIQVEDQVQNLEKHEGTFQFHEYNFQEKIASCIIPSIEPPPVGQNEKLVYFVEGLKIHHSSTSAYHFCRPPPARS